MMEQADRLVSSGLAGAGYEYVIVDGERSSVPPSTFALGLSDGSSLPPAPF